MGMARGLWSGGDLQPASAGRWLPGRAPFVRPACGLAEGAESWLSRRPSCPPGHSGKARRLSRALDWLLDPAEATTATQEPWSPFVSPKPGLQCSNPPFPWCLHWTRVPTAHLDAGIPAHAPTIQGSLTSNGAWWGEY